MERNTLVLSIVALVIVGLATPFELFGVPLAPIAAIIMGAIAGWMVAGARFAHGEAPGGGATAGLIVGVGALLGSILGLALLGLWIGNIPEVQAFVQNSEPHPEARIPSDWITPLGVFAGVVLGFFLGLLDLVLSVLAGWIAGLIYSSNHHPATIAQ